MGVVVAGEDPEYAQWVRARSCIVATHGCSGGSEAHHAGNDRGLGQKADDSTCVPLCPQHHREFHGATGYFKTMTKEMRRAWAKSAIERTQANYSRWLLPGDGEIPF